MPDSPTISTNLVVSSVKLTHAILARSLLKYKMEGEEQNLDGFDAR